MNETKQGNRVGTQMPESLYTKLNRLSEQAGKDPGLRFENIAHLISVEMLHWAFGELHKKSAAGVDGILAKDYAVNLQGNLADLHLRLKAGRYQAQPLRRIYIEKDDGKPRPLSIPALEDKILQRAVTELLSRIYENDFLPCSYGYRPGRGAHDALDAIGKDITFGQVSYVMDADISDYFGSIVRSQLLKMLQKRITDKNLLRLIGKWLHVGVIEEGRMLLSEKGTYQGSVISPVLANVYLHEVLDLWFEKEVKHRMRGKAKLYRYADDLVATFEHQDDAERFMQVLPKRFEKYGLALHPEKTRLIEFGKKAWGKSQRTGGKPKTFNFLGLTHYCAKSRKGKMVVKGKTMAKRLRKGITAVAQRCRKIMHLPIAEQRDTLRIILLGHYAYYGRRGNYRSNCQFYEAVLRIWKKRLSRRSNDGYIDWEKLKRIMRRYPLPKPRIVHGGLRPRSQMDFA